ncbi:MBL fold metallo-hydrolase [Aureimonas psammosilenae]|uniref:MBL fold metallo-hydrolase n=1 Tax=Aureimonas psammosilenae TaxID=2495496 RepID=UPI001260B696|nr:MBL fold metallo-hydrolase [Aureimonas psammosilenae]
MAEQIPMPESSLAMDEILDEARADDTHEVVSDVAWRRLGIVNVVFVGAAGSGDRNWVLIDAGIPGTRSLIEAAAEKRFGAGARPAAIVMTHGHFDHVGELESLAEAWDAPVYAHSLEHPYLNGQSSYPPGDPSVGGGLMAAMARFYPRKPVDVSSRLRALPADGSVPAMPGWRFIHTPGHSVGHVSLWRDSDRVLIVGDAFVTTRQESAYAALTQKPEMHGPPMYYTVEWDKARASVAELAALEPEIVLTGHGRPMSGPEMRAALHRLSSDFDEIAVPKSGRYLTEPARAEDGSAYR